MLPCFGPEVPGSLLVARGLPRRWSGPLVISASLFFICFIALVFAVPSAQQFRDAAVFYVVFFCFGSVVIRDAAGRVPAL